MGRAENVNSGFPWFKFWPADYLNDPALAMAPLAAQGLWMRAICHSYRTDEPGKLVGSADQLVRLLGCTHDELANFLKEARALKFADVREHADGRVEIISRRMVRDQKAREEERQAAAERQRRRRGAVTQDVTGAVTADVTGARILEPEPEAELDSKEKRERESGPVPLSLAPVVSKNGHRKPLTSWLENFQLTPEMTAYAVARGIDAEAEFEALRDHCAKNDERNADWSARWRIWIKRAVELGKNGKTGRRRLFDSIQRDRATLRPAAQKNKPKLPEDLGTPGARSKMVWGERFLGIIRDETGAWQWDPERDFDPAAEAAARDEAARERQ